LQYSEKRNDSKNTTKISSTSPYGRRERWMVFEGDRRDADEIFVYANEGVNILKCNFLLLIRFAFMKLLNGLVVESLCMNMRRKYSSSIWWRGYSLLYF
jgi:hypothetical protein